MIYSVLVVVVNGDAYVYRTAMIQVPSHPKLNTNNDFKSTIQRHAHHFEIEAAFAARIKTIFNSFSLIMVTLVSFCTFVSFRRIYSAQ